MTIFGKAGPLSTLLRATLHSSFGHSPLFFGPNKGGERLALGCSLVQTTALCSSPPIMRSQKRREKLFLLCASARDKTTFTSIKFIFVATMPPLQQSLTISLLRVALWWQKWQRTGDFNTFHVIFGAEMQFFHRFLSVFFDFLIRKIHRYPPTPTSK